MEKAKGISVLFFLRQMTLFSSKIGGETRSNLKLLTGEMHIRALCGKAWPSGERNRNRKLCGASWSAAHVQTPPTG